MLPADALVSMGVSRPLPASPAPPYIGVEYLTRDPPPAERDTPPSLHRGGRGPQVREEADMSMSPHRIRTRIRLILHTRTSLARCSLR